MMLSANKMKKDNIFDAAVKNDEVNDFFRGKNKYFVRDPDWDGHVYAAHYGSFIDDYLKKTPKNVTEFDSRFAKFVASLDVDEKDIDDFFGNLCAIAHWKSEGLLDRLQVFSDDSVSNAEIKNYLERIKRSGLAKEKKDLLVSYTNAIEGYGFKMPVKLF